MAGIVQQPSPSLPASFFSFMEETIPASPSTRIAILAGVVLATLLLLHSCQNRVQKERTITPLPKPPEQKQPEEKLFSLIRHPSLSPQAKELEDELRAILRGENPLQKTRKFTQLSIKVRDAYLEQIPLILAQNSTDGLKKSHLQMLANSYMGRKYGENELFDVDSASFDNMLLGVIGGKLAQLIHSFWAKNYNTPSDRLLQAIAWLPEKTPPVVAYDN